MEARTTTQSAYRCDTDLLIREVLQAAQDLFARTAREACSLLVHPLDGRALITAPIGKYGPLVYIAPDGRPRFRNMVIFHDHGLPPGMARVEVCDGCLSMWRSCENDTRRGADLEDALADLGGGQWGASAPEPAAPREPEAPPAPAVRRTRRASVQELKRRAKTAARKTAEAAEKAERARRLLETAISERQPAEED